MGIFSRLSNLIAAHLNALLDRAENPEVMLDHLIRELEDGLVRARRYAAVAVAAGARLRHDRDENRARGELWQTRARQALDAGREDLARLALGRKQEHDELARVLDVDHAEAVKAGQSARTAFRVLERRLAESRRKQLALLTRHRTAQIRVEVNRHLGIGRTEFGASQARFDSQAERLCRRVEELTAEAGLDDLSELETEFTDLERRRKIDHELEALKRAGQPQAD